MRGSLTMLFKLYFHAEELLRIREPQGVPKLKERENRIEIVTALHYRARPCKQPLWQESCLLQTSPQMVQLCPVHTDDLFPCPYNTPAGIACLGDNS